MKEKGFTLVELVAVIAILCILLIMFVPSLLNSINANKNKALEKMYDLIETSTRNYVMDYNIKTPTKIELEDLCETTYIDCPVINPNTDEELNGYVFVGNDYYYSEVESIKLSIDYDEGETSQTFNETYEPGFTIELNDATKEGYEFLEWEVVEGNSVIVGNKLTIGTEDTTIKPKFILLIAQALYIEEDNTLYFIKQQELLKKGDLYNNKVITEVYTGFDTNKYTSASSVPWYSYISNIKKVEVLHEISPTSTAYWFSGMQNCDSMDLTNLDTSKVTDMGSMFNSTGYNSPVFTLDLGDNFDTTQVTNMSHMFASTGYNSPVFTLDLGDNFDTTQVTNMINMFKQTGLNSPVFTLDLGDKFNTSSVTSMHGMFALTGYNSPVFTLDLGDKFNTSSVTNMNAMFSHTGSRSKIFTLDLKDNFDTSSVKDMSNMFFETGLNSPVFTLDLGDNFDTSSVTNMSYMFYRTGRSSTVFTLDLGDNFDTISVINMNNMFNETGKSPVFTLDLGEKFTFKDGVSVSNFATNCVASKLVIPRTVTNIPDSTFKGMYKLGEIVFEHSATDTITLPTSGSSTGAFYNGSNINTIVTTVNDTVKNYDWSSDKRTVTFN